jgi:hypothetical protein
MIADHHLAMLAASGIPPEHAAARGCETTHKAEVFEDGDSAFAYCSCGWVGQAYEDHPVNDEDPPYALAMAYNDRYGHLSYHRRERKS